MKINQESCRSMVKCVLFSFLLVVFLGCTRVHGMPDKPKIKNGDFSLVNIQSKWLLSRVEVGQFTTNTQGNRFKVFAQLANKSEELVVLEYQFHWFSVAGFGIAVQAQTWEQVLLRGNEVVTIEGFSPHVDAIKYKILLRRLGS